MAYKGVAHTKQQYPKRHAHTPERAIKGKHAAKLDRDLLKLDHNRAADQRGMGNTEGGGADPFRLGNQIKGIRIPVAVGLVDIGGQVISRIGQEKLQIKL